MHRKGPCPPRVVQDRPNTAGTTPKTRPEIREPRQAWPEKLATAHYGRDRSRHGDLISRHHGHGRHGPQLQPSPPLQTNARTQPALVTPEKRPPVKIRSIAYSKSIGSYAHQCRTWVDTRLKRRHCAICSQTGWGKDRGQGRTASPSARLVRSLSAFEVDLARHIELVDIVSEADDALAVRPGGYVGRVQLDRIGDINVLAFAG
jgi:hypothetical protein